MALATAAVLGWLASAPPADARSRVRHLAFRPVATATVLADGPHVLLGGRTLIDERTHAQTSIAPPPGCAPVAMGGPWIAASCGIGSRTPIAALQPALYSISARTWAPVALAPSIAASCATAADCQIAGVGRHWLGINEQLFPGGSSTVFQNLTTGQVRPDPTSATTLPDLSSPALTRTVCSPLRVPPSSIAERYATAGTLLFAGRFAVAIRPTSALSSTTYVQRCGSRSRTFVCHCAPGVSGSFRTVAANAHVVIWVPPTPLDAPLGQPVTHLDGMYLPSRRRFVIPLPAAARARGTESLLLTSRTLYIQNSSDTSRVFRARSPR